MEEVIPWKRTASKAPKLRRIGDDRDMLVMSFELEKEDVLKFKPLYEGLYTFFCLEEQWKHPHSDDDKIEDLYMERWPNPTSKEQALWWRLYKEPTRSKFIRYFIELNYQSINVQKAEAAYRNRKVSVEKNDLIVRGRLWLQWDYDDRLEKGIAAKFKNIFFKKVYREEIELRKKELQDFGLKLQRYIKNFFEMEADKRAPESLFSPMGYKDKQVE